MTTAPSKVRPSTGFFVALGTGLLVVAAWWWFLPCNSYKQAANMRLAEAHVAKIGPAIKADPRFASIEVHAYTGGRCGAMWVFGTVETEADVAALRDLITKSNPPTEVVFNVASLAGPIDPPSRPGR